MAGLVPRTGTYESGVGFTPSTSVTQRRDRFVAALRKSMLAKGEKLIDAARHQLQIMVEELRDTTPKDTGAAAGTTMGAKRGMYSSHPASGLSIGNYPGQSGWQIKDDGTLKRLSLINPMWDKYLAIVNYTHINGNFLERAVYNLRTNLRNLHPKV